MDRFGRAAGRRLCGRVRLEVRLGKRPADVNIYYLCFPFRVRNVDDHDPRDRKK